MNEAINDASVLPLAAGRARRPGDLVRRAAQLAGRKPLGAFGAAVLILMVLVAIGADQIAPYDPISNDQPEALELPSADHWFGTDQFGRDILSRVIFGARISLYVGVGATIVSMLPAIIIGIV